MLHVADLQFLYTDSCCVRKNEEKLVLEIVILVFLQLQICFFLQTDLLITDIYVLQKILSYYIV